MFPVPRYPDLAEKVIAITGAGQGLGRVYAHGFAAAGARVVVAEVDAEHGRAVADAIEAEGGSARFLHTDVTDEGSCAEMARTLECEWGGCDGLINNAAILASIRMKPFWELSVDEWEAMMAVNLTGTWLSTRALVGALRERRGAVVNMSSGVVFLGRPNYAHYVASKAGVIGLTRAMARELAEAGVRVNAITAGPIETEVPRETVSPEQRQALLDAQCVKRLGTPEDLLQLVMFLTSQASSYVSGQVFNIDGGLVFH